MRIERLEASKHKRGRVLLYLEDGSLLRLSERELLKFRLKPGMELGEEALAALKEAAGISSAREKAAELIARQPMSQSGLKRRLKEKGASDAEAEDAAAWLTELGALDDESYARLLVRHYSAAGYGKARLRQKLYEKGVDREVWDAALEEAEAPDEKIDAFIQKKLRGAAPEPAEKRRLSAALQRRGFGWDEIRAAWARYGSGIAEDEEGGYL